MKRSLFQPLEYVTLANIPSGQRGMLYGSMWHVQVDPSLPAADVTANWVEGCVRFYRTATEDYPGLVVRIHVSFTSARSPVSPRSLTLSRVSHHLVISTYYHLVLYAALDRWAPDLRTISIRALASAASPSPTPRPSTTPPPSRRQGSYTRAMG